MLRLIFTRKYNLVLGSVALLILCSAIGTAQASEQTTDYDLCPSFKTFSELNPETNPDLGSGKAKYPQFSPAVKNFIQGNYARSFKDYYASFFCQQYGAVYSGLNPVVEDAGLQLRFSEAMGQAADGRFFIAVNNMQSIVNELPTFGDARLMIGNLEWALGQKQSARATWKNTANGPYFTQPPNSETPIPILIAQDMLKIMK